MSLYQDHIATQMAQLNTFLTETNADALILTSGAPHYYYDDDIEIPHKMPASFLHWIPEHLGTHHYLILKKDQRILLSYRPNDYWLKVKSGYGDWQSEFTVKTFTDLDALFEALKAETSVQSLWLGSDLPETITHTHVSIEQKQQIDSWRLIKTPFEIEMMREATLRAAEAHLAVRDSFAEGIPEFQTALDYLDVLECQEFQLPYGNIIAYNENASILHYQDLDKTVPEKLYSFLIDAGAQYNGYIADISRTHPGHDADEIFITLLKEMRAIKLELISRCKNGVSYIDIHKDACALICDLLIRINVIQGCSLEEALEKGLIRTFFPHGVGHLLGLNTHDTPSIAKSLRDESLPFKSLRLTHHLKNGMVVTIEPGVYFNQMLVDEAKNDPEKAPFLNLELIQTLIPYGGIRDEDNIVIHDETPINLTADAFRTLGAEGF